MTNKEVEILDIDKLCQEVADEIRKQILEIINETKIPEEILDDN